MCSSGSDANRARSAAPEGRRPVLPRAQHQRAAVADLLEDDAAVGVLEAQPKPVAVKARGPVVGHLFLGHDGGAAGRDRRRVAVDPDDARRRDVVEEGEVGVADLGHDRGAHADAAPPRLDPDRLAVAAPQHAVAQNLESHRPPRCRRPSRTALLSRGAGHPLIEPPHEHHRGTGSAVEVGDGRVEDGGLVGRRRPQHRGAVLAVTNRSKSRSSSSDSVAEAAGCSVMLPPYHAQRAEAHGRLTRTPIDHRGRIGSAQHRPTSPRSGSVRDGGAASSRP